jgi:hypothetical protein
MSETRVATIISNILNPYYLLPGGLLVLSIGQGASVLVNAIIFITVGLLPLLLLHVVNYFRSQRDKFELDREQRTPIYLLGVLTFSLNTILFGSSLRNNAYFFSMAMVLAIWFGMHFLVNKYYDKASFHLSTFILISLLLLDQVNPRLGVLLLLLPLLIWSRIKLKMHDRYEILWGISLGFVGGLLIWLV